MRILHTADWHLGTKVPYIGLDRTDEQMRIVEKIVKIVEEKNVDVVIIAGDIFDNPTPSYQSEKIFYNFIASVCGDLKKYLFVISGNHDSMEKVDTVSVFSKFFNVNGSQMFKHFYLGGQIEKSLPNLICDVDGISFVGIPFVSRYRYSGRYQEIFELILGQLLERAGSEVVLFSHDTLEGVEYSGTEVEYSDKALNLVSIQKQADFDKVRYWALGHIHKYQEIVRNKIYYSGSIIQIDFGEEGQEKGVIIVDLDNYGVRTSFIPIHQERVFRKFDVLNNDYARKLADELKGTKDFVKVVIKGGVEPSLVESLKDSVSNLVLVKETYTNSSSSNIKGYRGMIDDPIKTFLAYYKENYGQDLPNDELEELKKIYDEVLNEADKNIGSSDR